MIIQKRPTYSQSKPKCMTERPAYIHKKRPISRSKRSMYMLENSQTTTKKNGKSLIGLDIGLFTQI